MKLIIIIIASLLVTMSLNASSAFGHRWCWTCDKYNTAGWQLMSPDERKEHQAKLASFTRYSSCKEYIDLHHKKMEERAAKKSVSLPVMRENPCDAMKAKGSFK